MTVEQFAPDLITESEHCFAETLFDAGFRNYRSHRLISQYFAGMEANKLAALVNVINSHDWDAEIDHIDRQCVGTTQDPNEELGNRATWLICKHWPALSLVELQAILNKEATP